MSLCPLCRLKEAFILANDWQLIMKNPTFLLFFFLPREGSPPTPSAFVFTIVMAPLLMSLELTGCNDWRLEPLLSLIVLLNGELEEKRMDGCAHCVQVSVSVARSLGKNTSAGRNWEGRFRGRSRFGARCCCTT